MDLSTVDIVPIAAQITAWGVVGGALWWGWRKGQPLRQMARDWQGAERRVGPGGVEIEPARPAAMERLKTAETDGTHTRERLTAVEAAQRDLHATVMEVHKILFPNGGSSVTDVLGQVLKKLDTLIDRPSLPEKPTIEASGLGFQIERSNEEVKP